MAHPFIPTANTALVELVYTAGAVVIENTFHVQKGSPYTLADLTALAGTFDTWDSTGTAAWKGVRTQQSVLIYVRAKALDTSSSPVYTYTVPAGGRVGTLAGSGQLPNNASFCVRLQTGLAGRSFRGRIYVPPFYATQLQASPAQNLITTAYALVVITSLQALMTALTAAGHTWVVTSFYNSGAWRTAGVNTAILTIGYADLRVDTQRRRLI
jgi:hypothetical protein